MPVYLVLMAPGIFLLDERGNIIVWTKWSDDEDKTIEYLVELEEGKVPPKIFSFINSHKDKIDTLIVEDNDLARKIASEIKSLEVRVEPGNVIARNFRSKMVEMLPTLGLSRDWYYDFIHRVSVEITRRKVRKAAEKRDMYVAQAINALDDINKTINLLASRVREWYSLHFPELDEIIDDHEEYLKIVTQLGSRDDITEEGLRKLGIDEDNIRKIIDVAKSSMGASLAEFDLDAIRLVSGIGLDLYDARRRLEKYIDEAMLEVAPNIRGLVGPLLGARLISLAGGLSRLARLPASTIQVLGAEKALFRALRTGGRPPKHGVIFQYPAIHRSPRWQRGKIARALAAKLAIAARIDAFTGEYKADELKEELEKRIEEIKTLYAKPPKRPRPISKKPSRGKKRKRGRR